VTRSARVRQAATVSHVPGTSRRAQHSASTRRALVDVAEGLFAEYGYAATSLDAIVAGAQVTKGALYHHFAGKRALFEAVFDKVETSGAR
jgi:AcrR family transcriptional regulator